MLLLINVLSFFKELFFSLHVKHSILLKAKYIYLDKSFELLYTHVVNS